MDRPPPVRIDDLADPRFPPHIEEVLAAAEAMADDFPMTPEPLLAKASAEVGLGDFGADDFLERMGLLLDCLDTEVPLRPFGRIQASSLVTQLLENRLLIRDLLTRVPEIEEQRIDRPIVIAGQPRTGTTHLHNLLAADPDLRYLPYWESLEPVLSEFERPDDGQPDPRIARCEQGLWLVNEAMPLFRRMHEMTVEHAHEEIQLLAIDFSTMLFETMGVMPSWRDDYLARDQTPHYEYLRTVLQVLQWLRGGTRWVLKSPQHLEQFEPLLEVFPDAFVVVTHRDPAAVLRSMVTMIAYTARLSHAEIDLPKLGSYWRARLVDACVACSRDRHFIPEDQSLDVHFDEFMADDFAMVQRVYAAADQPLGDRSRESMRRFLAEHPRGRFGAIEYDLRPFELDEDEIRSTLAPYIEQFGVGLERD